MSECPRCNSTTIQNKETKWECEDCAFSWDKDSILDNQIDEIDFTQRVKDTSDLSLWTFEHNEDSNYITLRSEKKVIVNCHYYPMLLHEIAHILSDDGHTGMMVDVFTELVGLNMIEKQRG